MKKNNTFLLFVSTILCFQSFGQWQLSGNTVSGAYIGTNNAASFRIFTEGIHLASFTYGNSLNAPIGGGSGDGLRIFNATLPTNPIGVLDLFTTSGNKTHVQFSSDGSINGKSGRMDYLANGAGFWFNATSGKAIWNRGSIENARMGDNTYWRFGFNAGNTDAQRRVEIVDVNQQLRLTNGTTFSEFFTRTDGRLLIMPYGYNTGFTDVNDLAYNPTERIDVKGTGRFRAVSTGVANCLLIGTNNSSSSDITMHRLDFTGNAGQVLLGNGTWGTLPSTAPLANNGVSRNVLFNGPYQLGDVYNNFLFNTNTPLTVNRQVRLNNQNFVFSGLGKVGIGLSFPVLPTEVLDVNGNARFRDVPVQGGQSIILGLQNGANTNDIELSRLVFPNDPTVALLGNGTFGPISTFSANNGNSINGGNIVFGQDLNQIGDPAQLLNTRQVPLRGNNILFTDNGRLGIGSIFSTPGFTPLAKLDIRPTSVDPFGLYINNANNMSSIPLYTMNNISNQATGTLINTSLNVVTAGNPTKSAYGIRSNAIPSTTSVNIGIEGFAQNALQTNYGGYIYASSPGGQITYGIYSGGNSSQYNNGGGFRGGNPGDVTSILNQGIFTEAYGGQTAYGIYAYATGATSGINRAAFFNGDVEQINGIFVSDQQFKTNVQGIDGSLKTLALLKPHTYFFDTLGQPRFAFGSEKQYGFIAQEIENVFPSLVHQSLLPAQLDSLGNELSPAIPYKSLNYVSIIPINTAVIIELNQKVDKATLSDQSIKTNVQDLTGSLNKVLNMHGVSYDWDHTVHPELNLDSVNHIGFIAQEMAQIDPRVTYMTDDSLLHIEYDKVVPILAEAIQELNTHIDNLPITSVQNQNDSLLLLIQTLQLQNNAQGAQINDLNSRLTQLENCLSGILPFLCQMSQSAIQANTPQAQEAIRTELTVRLSNQPTIILDQNVPNPFAEQTIINFSISETVKKAQIHFYDGMGKLLQSVDVVERGLGSITVFGSDLSSGIYTYTLVADGQIVATKKMMKQ